MEDFPESVAFMLSDTGQGPNPRVWPTQTTLKGDYTLRIVLLGTADFSCPTTRELQETLSSPFIKCLSP